MHRLARIALKAKHVPAPLASSGLASLRAPLTMGLPRLSAAAPAPIPRLLLSKRCFSSNALSDAEMKEFYEQRHRQRFNRDIYLYREQIRNSSLELEDVSRMKHNFQIVLGDSEETALDRERFGKLLSHYCLGYAVNTDRYFDLFDKDNDGKVDLLEFVNGMALLKTDFSIASERDTVSDMLFEALDVNGDGSLQRHEIEAFIVDMLGTFVSATVGVQDIQHLVVEILEEMGLQADSEMSKDDFKVLLERYYSKEELMKKIHQDRISENIESLRSGFSSSRLPASSLDELRKDFLSIADADTAALDKSGVQKIIQHYVPHNQVSVDRWMSMLDKDLDGFVDLQELISGMVLLKCQLANDTERHHAAEVLYHMLPGYETNSVSVDDVEDFVVDQVNLFVAGRIGDKANYITAKAIKRAGLEGDVVDKEGFQRVLDQVYLLTEEMNQA